MTVNNDNFNWEELGMTSDEEIKEINERLKKTEEEGIKNILKYFDRIHDKLFTFNNILIAGYFALSKLVESISTSYIIIPLVNLAFLLYIEYRNMEKSRFEADIKNKTSEQIDKYGNNINVTTLYSLGAILSTTLVTLFFLYKLICLSPESTKINNEIQTSNKNDSILLKSYPNNKKNNLGKDTTFIIK